VANVACVLFYLLGFVNQASTAVRTRSFRKTGTVANCFFLGPRSGLPCCPPVPFWFTLLSRPSSHHDLACHSGYWLGLLVTPVQSPSKTGIRLCRLAVPFCFPLLPRAFGILTAAQAFALPVCLPLCVCVLVCCAVSTS